MTDRIIGCPHEEGIDYEGASCPAPQPLHDPTPGQMPLAGAWSRTIARLGLKWSPASADAALQQ
jgi:hypothetical protein